MYGTESGWGGEDGGRVVFERGAKPQNLVARVRVHGVTQPNAANWWLPERSTRQILSETRGDRSEVKDSLFVFRVFFVEGRSHGRVGAERAIQRASETLYGSFLPIGATHFCEI